MQHIPLLSTPGHIYFNYKSSAEKIPQYKMASPPVSQKTNLLHYVIHTNWTGAFSTIKYSKIAYRKYSL